MKRNINFKEKLKKSLFEQIIEKTSNNWDLMYIELNKWLSEKNNYPSKHENHQLYIWISSQRNKRKKNLLSNYQIQKLDEINFMWNSHENSWNEKYEALKQYRINHEYEPSEQENDDLYGWLRSQRSAESKGLLSQEKIDKLNSLKFKGRYIDRIWNEKYIELSEYRKTNEYEPNKNEFKELYQWYAAQKMAKKKGELSEERIKLLDSLNFKGSLQDIIWEEKYQMLITYRKKSEYEPSIEESKDLYQWLGAQKLMLKKGLLSDERIKKLDILNFKGSLVDKQWEEIFNLLLVYRKNNPDRWPSQRSKEPIEHKLAVWFMKQRKGYRENILSDYRKSKLESINFPWEPYDFKWNQNYSDLLLWLKKTKIFPTANVNDKKEFSLWTWCSRQKELYLNHELEANYKAKLDKINFVDFVERQSESLTWDDIYYKVKEYHFINKKFPSQNKNNTPDINSMATWCTNQRKRYKEKNLSQAEFKKLYEIGFIFDTEKKREEDWDAKLEKLIEYRKINPNQWPNLNSNDNEEKKLAVWINYNRQWYKGNNEKYKDFPIGRKNKLDSINFEWEADWKPFGHEYNWDDRYLELKQQLENNTFQCQDSDGKTNSLYTWLVNQKNKYKEGKLDADQISKLESIGFDLGSGILTGRLNLSWDEFYEILKKQVISDDFRSIDDNGKVTPVYNWLTRQKSKYKEGKLSTEQISKIESIGIDLQSNINKINSSWDSYYNQLKDYFEKNNSLKIPSQVNGKTNPLYNWLQRQMNYYKDNKLDEGLILKLKTIGIIKD